jgi:hypothetical protein
LTLETLTSPGMNLAVRDGLPNTVPREEMRVAVSAQLPACSALPPGGRSRPRLGTIMFEVKDQLGRRLTYVPPPGGALSTALIALRERICPRRSSLR